MKELTKAAKLKKLLVGTWINHKSAVEFTVGLDGGKVVVTALDVKSGEAKRIQDVTWNGKDLKFISVMPSTGFVLRHVFRPSLAHPNSVENEYTSVANWERKMI